MEHIEYSWRVVKYQEEYYLIFRVLFCAIAINTLMSCMAPARVGNMGSFAAARHASGRAGYLARWKLGSCPSGRGRWGTRESGRCA